MGEVDMNHDVIKQVINGRKMNKNGNFIKRNNGKGHESECKIKMGIRGREI